MWQYTVLRRNHSNIWKRISNTRQTKKRGQSQDTMDALKVCSSTIYCKGVHYFANIFTGLKELNVPDPKEPLEVTVIGTDEKVIITPVSRFKEILFMEELKQWIKDTQSLKLIIQSMYNTL